jgi:hypothetical protein
LKLKEKTFVRKLICAVAFLAISALLAAQQTLNNDAIVKMVKAGFSDDLIVSTVNGVAGSYDLSADGLIALKAAGVSEKVVAAIVAKVAAPTAAPAPAAGPAASDPNDPAAPHEPGIYMVVKGADGKNQMVRLEQKESNTEIPLTSCALKAKIPGANAELRTTDLRPVFYLYFPSTSGITDAPNPNQFTPLVLNGKKDHREAEVAHCVGFRGSGAFATGFDETKIVAASAEKVRPNVFKLTLSNDLKPAEYAFAATMKWNETHSASFFDFGVDAK